MEKDIFLIRHSEQLKIKDTKKYDISDQINNEKIILSVNGEILAREISELQVMQNINMVWSSNYVRALETAKYIAEKNNIEINVDSRLNERKLGDLEKLREFLPAQDWVIVVALGLCPLIISEITKIFSRARDKASI